METHKKSELEIRKRLGLTWLIGRRSQMRSEDKLLTYKQKLKRV